MCFKRKQINLQGIQGNIVYPTKEILKTYALNYYDRLVDREFNDLIETMRNMAIEGEFKYYYKMPNLYGLVVSDLPQELKDLTKEKIKQEIINKLEALDFTVETTVGFDDCERLKISWGE